MKGDETVAIRVDDLLGLFERIDQLTADVEELKQRVAELEDNQGEVKLPYRWQVDVPTGDKL